MHVTNKYKVTSLKYKIFYQTLGDTFIKRSNRFSYNSVHLAIRLPRNEQYIHLNMEQNVHKNKVLFTTTTRVTVIGLQDFSQLYLHINFS